jgi:hypothetical protein
MKTSILVAAIVACALSAPVVSAQEESAPAKPVMSTDVEQLISWMQENMEKMQQQMEKLRTTIDPKERRKLMQEHIQAMQENMKTMHGMGGPTMGCDQRVGMAKGRHKDEAPDDMMKHHEMMEKRMDMLQKLTD